MTKEKIIRFILGLILYTIAIWLADIVWWKFFIVSCLILSADKTGIIIK